MAIRADRVGVREDQVDVHGRVTSPSFLNELLEDLPEWTDMPVWVNGTEELLPSNNSVPVTSPILADIAYPDIRRDNQYFTYRESPTPVDGLAKIKSIKGNTLKWNQLQSNNTSRTNAGITYTYDNGKLTVTGTATSTSWWLYSGLPEINMKANHKYLIVLGNSVADSSLTTYNWYLPNSGQRFYTDKTIIAINNDVNQYLQLQVFKDYTIDAVFYPQVFDLTQIYGSGNEPATVEEFTSFFSLPYYDYNAGTLLSFNGTGIKTVGKNLFQNNAVSKTQSGITFTINDDKSITVNGTATGTAYITHGEGLSAPNIKKGESLILSGSLNLPQSRAYFQLVYEGVSTGTIYSFVSTNASSVSINATEDMTLGGIYFNIQDGTTVDNLTAYPMLRYAGTDPIYEPYTSHTTNLPVSTYFPTGMKSAGTVYDELTPIKAITRIGAVDLGSLNYTMYQVTQGNLFRADLTNANLPYDSTNIICAKYSTLKASVRTDKCVCVGSAGRIDIIDSSFNDVNAFKTAMSGVYLYYELATPVELPTMSFE